MREREWGGGTRRREREGGGGTNGDRERHDTHGDMRSVVCKMFTHCCSTVIKLVISLPLASLISVSAHNA